MFNKKRNQLKARAGKSKGKGNDVLLSAIRYVVGFAGTLYLSFLLLFPQYSGTIGQAVSTALAGDLGVSRYLLPLFLIHGLVRYFRQAKGGWITLLFGYTFSLITASALAHILVTDSGGALGAYVAGTIAAGLGTAGAFLFCLAGLLFALQISLGVRWGIIAQELARVVGEDFRDWQKSREELRSQVKDAKGAAPKPEAEVSPKDEPKNVNTPSASAPAPAKEEKIIPKRIEPPPAPKAKTNGEVRAQPAAAPTDSPYKNYVAPPLDLLKPPPADRDRGKPSDLEIKESIAKLEATLKSFEIEARVTGYAPGPVITRYELAPAPGVKVSSIVALENDIALAMKAKGIRIIAPIPGKAAVGIEIPNAKPALVVLRELLESSAVTADAPLLTFGLGLSADGLPKSADIQKMPHVLVAGATNSGKSVAIHSMILSILYRARPDEVKFLMIDPKRLELTFYDGIPHLFDPTQTADKVCVVTSPKDASKSLNALVRLMEKRYERFQLFGVRNIDSYNAEADKRGQPREFFIVVVIDELADLMLVAADSVEDSIQRLTQMARAVGIHLVLATQRPSVDVITGVIKANLPCRIGLQVISKIDSKVILDCTGAEALQGRGDLLYLAAGAQKPERCQGAFVSEDEINAVVKHLRAQGKPEYAPLETMAAKGGAAEDLASLGVEPLEFSQALKLVLERRRVSQDLLKSQFGSSARATNLLSALEVKELIHKPEGTNRWEIHFDQIEDYLRANFPQVPIDDKR